MVVDGFCVPLVFPHDSPGPPSSEHLCWWRSTCPPPPSCIHLCIPVFVMTKLWWKPWRPALWALLWSSAQVCLLPFPALQLLHGRPQLAPFPLCPRLVLAGPACESIVMFSTDTSAAQRREPRGTRRSGEGTFPAPAETSQESLWSLSR